MKQAKPFYTDAEWAAVKATNKKQTTRMIWSIAEDIRADWKNVNYAAAPYLAAMHGLSRITDTYYADSGERVVLGFLSNAASYRGEKAKALKAELKAILKSVGY